jgi:hypothetical protein
VFEDPAHDDRLVPAAEYLSGDVRQRLAIARAAAERAAESGDDTAAAAYEAGTAALEQVVPPDIAPEDIVARLGASWISKHHVQQFLRETLEDPGLTVAHDYGANWTVEGREHGVAATSTWGTDRVAAPDLAEHLLCQRPIIVLDKVGDGERRVPNVAAAVAAQAKADELADRFSEWVWEDPPRAVELARIYNDTFNSLVVRNYDDVALSLPGLALTFTPRPHQVAAVARMISEPASGLWHTVGAGKTAEMAMGVMELRRLGLARKPAIVIPNHMIEQFAREFQQIYPRARVLAVSSAELTRARRREFVARVATGDWDAVIMTRSAFERIELSREHQQSYLDNQLQDLRDGIDRAKTAGEGKSVKRMQATLVNAEERIKARLDREYDPAVTFEQTGIDYLVVDEAHDFKNLATASRIPGANITGSVRASDLEMKLHHLRDTHPGGRVVTFATATPIANSITEAHVMLRYLRPDLLDAAGVADFDTWAATFGQTVTEVELAVDGGSFRMKSRFARFHNVPELLRLWWVAGDVKTTEDLQLPRPPLAAGPDGSRVPRTITIPATPELQDFIADLGERADRVRARAVEPEDDNMLKIAGDGRLAALDLRLVGGEMSPGESKIERVADEIAQRWAAHRNDRFTDTTGVEHPTPGALQLVFCDLSTPRTDRWNVYDALREQLTIRGLPAGSVQFIHEPRNDREKAQLFEACRSGQVSVLVGSTAKMGVGTNVQARAVALHHMDCPWRPADLEQRDGRIERQGNQNREIEILRYVTQGSFDAYSWQTVARKAAFIAQLMRGRLGVRVIEGDVGDTALSFSEVKALAAGNPLLMDKAKADAEATRLERLERSHVSAGSRLRYSITNGQQEITSATAQITALEQAVAARRDTHGDRFTMTIEGLRFSERTDAGQALATRLLATLQRPDPSPITIDRVVSLGGHTFDATIWRGSDKPHYELALTGIPQAYIHGEPAALAESKPSSLPIRLENVLGRLDRLLSDTRDRLTTTQEEIDRAEEQLHRPFGYADELTAARARVAEIDQQLIALAKEDAARDLPDQPSDKPVTAPATGPTTDVPATGPTPDPDAGLVVVGDRMATALTIAGPEAHPARIAATALGAGHVPHGSPAAQPAPAAAPRRPTTPAHEIARSCGR